MAVLCGDVFISKLRRFRLSFAVFQYSSIPIILFLTYPTILCEFYHTCEKYWQECGSSLYFYFNFFINLFSCVSKIICLLILAPLKNISWKEFKFKTMKRRNASDDGERGNKKLLEQAMCESSSSQESSSTPCVKNILRRWIEQKLVQQNEYVLFRSQDNANLSNWASILSNLGYFCEVRSIIAARDKIHGAYCRFDHWIVKSRVHLH